MAVHVIDATRSVLPIQCTDRILVVPICSGAVGLQQEPHARGAAAPPVWQTLWPFRDVPLLPCDRSNQTGGVFVYGEHAECGWLAGGCKALVMLGSHPSVPVQKPTRTVVAGLVEDGA